MELTEQVVVVTGAGRGLGRHYALDLARRGAAVVVNDLGCTMAGDGADPSLAEAVVAEIEDDGGTALASPDTVATSEGGEAIVQAALDRFGRLDAVVSNAGVFGSVPFQDLTAQLWRRMLGTHLDGGFHVALPAYRVMKAAGYGRFVFVSSSAGMFGQPQEAHYAAAKTGLVGLSNVIAIEGREHGIRSNCLLPFGFSRMVQETVGDPAALGPEVQAFLQAIRPELIAPMVSYLASRECAVTHQNFSAAAGRFARVFVGIADGWTAPAGTPPTAEDVAARIEALAMTEPYAVPESIFDEVDRIWAGVNP